MEITTGLHSAQKFALLLRRLASRLARPRHRTYGREFLLLTHPTIRTICWRRMEATDFIGITSFWAILVTIAYFLARGYWLAAGLLSISLLTLPLRFVLSILNRIRREVLLPRYLHQRYMESLAAYCAAAHEFNATLPPKGYRVVAPPDVSPDSLPRLRQMADERRLPAALEGKFVRVERAQAGLKAAELALSEAQTDKERPASKAT